MMPLMQHQSIVLFKKASNDAFNAAPVNSPADSWFRIWILLN